SAAERLRGRDFTQLSGTELRQLTGLMREMTLAVPPRRTRRYRSARDGKRPDLRRTLRQARRTGGEAITFARRAPRVKPRRLIVLCDISGSMEPYARALLMLLYCLNGGQLRGGPGHDAGQGRRGGARLVRRDQDRRRAQGVQRSLRLPWPGPGSGGPDHLRRLGDRRARTARRAD